MTSLLKNQILKHLSKFTKNLSPDRLNVSAIKGEGELSNLELDEAVLTDLLELPTWLKIARASCNRVAIKIQWTKLKSQPICLYLDEVVVEMETCETPRPPNSTAGRSPLSPGGKYGFIDKTMDGIYVHINSVVIKMMSRIFNASLQLSRVKVHSPTPTWDATYDLRKTRVRDTGRGEILVFKEIEWQTTRIEAAADESVYNEVLTPLRLIANQAKIRIVVKKRLSDCSILSSRVILLLDDLLWVLTVTQLKAAMLYANSLKEVIERSSQQSKRLAAEKLKMQGTAFQPQLPQQQARASESSNSSSSAKLFTRFDVATTSYHLVTSRFDLHLCDDTATPSDPRRHWDIANGSMQITFFKLSFDFYPFHPAGGERKGWFRYTDNVGTRNPWVTKLFAAFREDAVKIRKVCGSPSPSPSASSSKIAGGSLAGSSNPSPAHSPCPSTTPSPSRSPSHHSGQQQQQQRPKSTRLLESCCVIKVEDMTIYMVSTPKTKRGSLQKFLVSDKKQLHLPSDMSVVHMEYTEYYFPDGIDYPVPHANLYILVNPVKMTVDFLTLLWTQYFFFTLAQSMEFDLGDEGTTEHIDIKLEALMPRVVVPGEAKGEGQPERPDAVQMQISKLTASNCRVDDKLTHKDLRRALDIYYGGHLFHTADFPNDSLPHRLTPWQLENHASSKDNPYLDKSIKALLESDPNLLQWPDSGVTHALTCNSLKMDAFCDVWGLHLEQVWVEFLGVQSQRNRPVPCVEAFPLTMWLGITYNPTQPPTQAHLSVQSNATLRSDTKGSNSDSPNSKSEERPGHLPLSGHESFEECRSLQSDELNVQQQPQADSTAFLLCNFGAKMRVQVNHFQYLLLSRVTQSLAKFQEELSADLALWGSTKTAIIHLPVVFEQSELAIICPYQMHQRTFSDDFSPSLPNLLDVFGSGSGASSAAAAGVCGGGGGTQSLADVTLVLEASEKEVTNPAYMMEKAFVPDNNNIIPVLNASTSKAASSSSLPTSNTTTGEQLGGGLYSGEQHQFTTDHRSSQMSTSAGTDSGIGLERKSSLKNSKTSKGAEVKKAFSSAFSNLTDKFKNTFDDNLSDDFDSMSLATDTSDDDDIELLSLEDTEEVPAFIREGRSDAGSNPDTYSDMETSSIYADSSTTKGREMVSLILFKFGRVESLLQVSNTGVALSAQVSHVLLHQPGNVGYDDFYGKFSSPKGFLQEDSRTETDNSHRFPIRMKMMVPSVPLAPLKPPASDQQQPPPQSTHTSAAATATQLTTAAPSTTPATTAAGAATAAGVEEGKEASGELTMRVEDYSLHFKMSGLTSLTEFVEDESEPQVVPMSVTIKNFLIVLDEDRHSSTLSAAGTLPMNCHIDQLYISRGMDGIYYITSGRSQSGVSREGSPGGAEDTDTVEARGPNTPSSTSSHMAILIQTQAENAQLRLQCEELNRANKLYEEQILLLRDKMRELELQVNQRTPPKARSHSVTSNHLPMSSRERRLSVEGRRMSGDEAGIGLEVENMKLQERVLLLEEQLSMSNREKESLVATLQFLQEELLQSERQARNAGNSSGR